MLSPGLCSGSGFGVSGIEIRDLGFRIRDSGFGVEDPMLSPDLGQGFELRVWGFGVQGFESRGSGFG